MGRKLRGLHLLLLLLSTTSSAVHADYRRMVIDPSPTSPTLGDILDHNKPAPPRPNAKPAMRPRPAPPVQPASHLPVSDTTSPKARPHPSADATLRVGLPPVALGPALPNKARAVKLHQAAAPAATPPTQPPIQPEMLAPMSPSVSAAPGPLPAAPAVQGLAPVSAKQLRPLTTLAVKRREVAVDPIMTGTTVPPGVEAEATKTAPADIAQPLPTVPAREAGKKADE